MAAPDDEQNQDVQPEADAAAPAEAAGENPAESPAPGQERPRRRSLLGTLFSTVMILLVVAAGLGYAAIALKDKDERIALVAGYAEQALAESETAIETTRVKIAELLGEKPPAQVSKVTTHRTVPLAQAPSPQAPEPAPEPAPQAPEPVAEAEPPPPAPKAAEAPAQPQTPIAEPSSPTPPAVTAAAPPAQESAGGEGVEARLLAATDTARKALAAAEAAQAAAEAAGKSAMEAAEKLAENVKRDAGADSDGLTAKEMASALEGRIDELGNQLKALREKLDSPKNETRAAPETDAVKAGDGAASMVVVAYALQRELDAGRPYADEVAALTRLGADSGPIGVLSAMAEKGAPTAAQLAEQFHAIAKKLHAEEGHADDDLAGHILHGASKLVKVRPTGQADPQTMDGKIAKIEAALAHGDFAAAETAFASLPDAAKSQAKEFGDALGRRAEAARAADGILHGAIAALGSDKK